MGPQVAEIALKLGGDWMHDLGYFRHASGMLAGVEVLATAVLYRQLRMGADLRPR